MTSLINYLTRVQFGCGAIKHLAAELETLGISTPLIVTDRGLSENGLIDTILKGSALKSPPPIFDATPANPTEVAVEDALAVCQRHGCDGIVAIGGGSSLDLAKGLALLATHAPPLRQYAVIENGAERITSSVLPIIAVPTTAGTGSEVGRGALITLRDQRKLGFLSPHLIPALAICDPELTRSLPPYLTAATGMDAIAHCVETYLSPRHNPPAEAIALDGLGRAALHLRTAVANGDDMEARSEMMMAALEGAMAFQKGLGAVHSLSHALGGLQELKLHHGTLNALLLPTVLRFNAPACEAKYRRLREVLGLPADADLAAFFETLTKDLGLPTTLQELDVTPELFEQTAQWALEDHSTATNPRTASREDFQHMLEAASA
jgi:alcohol dehydrogenase class IV